MENKIENYVHEEFGEIKVLRVGDKFWFPASDCARILGYTSPRDAVMRHCKGVVKCDIPTAGGIQKINMIAEGDLYRLIIRSNLESAQRFEEWVFDEVLPNIRKNGVYVMPQIIEELQRNTAKNAELLRVITQEQKERYRLEEKTKNLEDAMILAEPKISFYDTILQNPTAIPITVIAKDYGMSGGAFNTMLHDLHIQYCIGDTWLLYQKYAGKGYTHANTFYTGSGKPKVITCWTQKGRMFLYEFLKDGGILPNIE